MICTRSDRSEEAFHEWRKRTKDLRYELELLQSTWLRAIKTVSRKARALTDLLGHEHDLAMLWITAQQVLGDPLSIEDEQLYVLIAERRATLQRKSTELGVKLFKKKPRAFVRFIRRIGG